MSIEQRIEAARIDAARADIARGFEMLYEAAGLVQQRIEELEHISGMERRRQAAVLRRERAWRDEERRRAEAQMEVSAGKVVNIHETAIGPTEEQELRGDFVNANIFEQAKRHTIVETATVRNLASARILQLYNRGVLDKHLYVACRWYMEKWIIGGLNPIGASSYEEHIPSQQLYGFLARSIRQLEARDEYHWARRYIPPDLVDLFEAIVLHDLSIADAAKAVGCRFANAKAAFLLAAQRLHTGILARLDNERRKERGNSDA